MGGSVRDCVPIWAVPGQASIAEGRHGYVLGRAMSAFTSTLIQVGGPPFHIFILPQRLEN